VVLTLQRLFPVRGAPEHLRSDNGSEFVAWKVPRWISYARVRALHTQKTSPWENGYVESFSGNLRELFLCLEETEWC